MVASQGDGVAVRAAVDRDFGTLHAINAAAVPGVGAVAQGELARLAHIGGFTAVAESAGQVVGFILCMTEGCDYASRNYRWISERYGCFAYCDRIAVAAGARGKGVGELLYQAAERHYAGSRDVLLCEVNLEPPNPGSLRFHERRGFRRVGESWLADRSYGVVYMEKRL